jgi:hypothetical protein
VGLVDFDPGAGNFYLTGGTSGDFFISKLNPSGNFVWATRYSALQQLSVRSIKVDGSGNVFTAGDYTENVVFNPGAGSFGLPIPSGARAGFVSKLNSSGTVVWAKNFHGLMGTTNLCEIHGLTLDQNGDIYVAGHFRGSVDFDPGPLDQFLSSGNSLTYDGFICKLDANGNLLWVKKFGASTTTSTYVYSMSSFIFGNFYLGGMFSGIVDFDPGPGTSTLTSGQASSFYMDNVFVCQFDASGNLSWARKMGGDNTSQCRSVAADNQGNVYSTGYFIGTGDFDPGSGVLNLSTAGNYHGAFASKLDLFGNFVWAKHIAGTSQFAEGKSIDSDASSVYIMGAFEGTSDFDPESGTFNLTSSGNTDLFISRLDASTGNFITATKIGGPGIESVGSLHVTNSGQVFSTGGFTGTVDFDPGPGVFNISAVDNSDIFVQKWSSLTVNLKESAQVIKSIYPNPAEHFVNIELDFPVRVEVYTITGVLVDRLPVQQKHILNIADYAPGMYLLKAENQTTLLVKQ